MARIVGVHGIGNIGYFRQSSGRLAATRQAVGDAWTTWTRAGLERLNAPVVGLDHLPVAYYADCLYQYTALGPDDDLGTLEPFAQELFVAWAAALLEQREPRLEQVAQGRLTRRLLRQPAEWITTHYGEAARQVVVRLSEELAIYFGPEHADRRTAARRRVIEAIAHHRPAVVVAHSLGSVVTYEALCAEPGVPIDLLITVGSPLGVSGVIFERLEPVPDGRGIRPPGVCRWINIADVGDPVAIPAKRLAERFDGLDEDHEVSIHTFDPHSVRHYLRCEPLARALAPHTAG
ncbi:hypothetical protein [Acrocarpospora catenulata]|uniref:hypothetical protein n=1 Tax=Acrocarpospora catenulata TaxID=2836182 RepID=UPI001BDAB205|nr:hypothetical protein [Acrocarpospora catenulata]